jgi:hypothetical protein
LGAEIWPPLAGMIPAMHFISVDFPAPLCPAKAMRSRGWTEKERLLKRTRAPYWTRSVWTEIMERGQGAYLRAMVNGGTGMVADVVIEIQPRMGANEGVKFSP